MSVNGGQLGLRKLIGTTPKYSVPPPVYKNTKKQKNTDQVKKDNYQILNSSIEINPESNPWITFPKIN